MPTGLPVGVYRHADGHDCTNNGVSSKFKEFTLIVPGQDIGPFEPSEKAPALYLRSQTVGGKVHLSAVPSLDDGKWYMFGGNFIFSSDGRLPGRTPIPIHDRCEQKS